MAALAWATLRCVTKRRVHNEFYFEISPLQFVELNQNLICVVCLSVVKSHTR